MDYDGNVSQGHNLKVAGEGTSKSSSALRPYAFPRFELDDSLQGHLRFDSLVETDVFLGIRSQDESHWIPDFSRGSDVIDLRSTATDSCSIAGQSNVWFEAASSESVEMLLKSVGQEQIRPKDTVSESNNICKELCSLEKKMEPKFEQDNVNSVSTRMSNDMLQDELLSNVSGLENHVKTKMLQVEGISLSSENMDLKEECNLLVTGEALLSSSVYGMQNVQESVFPAAFGLDQAGDSLSHSAGSAKDINASSMVPSLSQDLLSSHNEGSNTLSRATGDGIKEQLALEVHVDSQILEQHKLKDDAQSDIFPASKVASASTDSVLLTDNLEQHVTKLGNPNGEQCSRSEANMDSVEELDLKFSSDEVDNVTESPLKDGKKGNLVLGSNSQSSLIKGENEPSRDNISNTKIVDVAESLIGPVSSSSAGLSRSSGYKEDSEVKADQQSNAIENADDSVQAEKKENVSLPGIIIDASSGTCVAPTGDLVSSTMMRNTSQDEPIVNQLHSENEDASDIACKINDNEDIHKQVAAEVGVACESKSGIHHCSPTSNSGSELHPDCDDSAVDKDSVKHECNSPTFISSVITPPDGGSEIAENMPSTSQDLKGKVSSLDDNSFTFKVNLPPYSEAEKANTWTPFPIAETYNASVVLEEVRTPDAEKTKAKLAQETCSKGISKATSGRKRKGSEKGAAKESSRKGVIIKETMPDITSTVSLSSGSSLPGQFTGSRPHVLTSDKSKKQSMKSDVPTSNLPDLNALALKNHGSPLTAYYQPFTELQQIQLRAQIFVYGSLIQGTAPDEACMISAFRSSGRGMWETIWQASVERVRRQRSKPAAETPLKSNSSGAKVPELSGRKVSPETKVFPSSVSPLIPLPSPLWSFSTPYHDVSQSSNLQNRPVLHYQPTISPRQPYHTPPVQNIIGHTTWQPQSQALWVSQTSAIDTNARLPTTAVRDLSSPAPSFVKNLPSPSSVHTDTTSTVTVHAKSSQLADSKPRRRKKAQPLDTTPHNLSYSQAHTETLAASSLPTLTSPLALVTSHSSSVTTPVGFVFSACSTSPQQVADLETLQKAEDADSKPRRRKKAQAQVQTETIVSSSLTTPIPNVLTACSTSQQAYNLDAGKASPCSSEILQKVEDARLLSEEAAGFAATAVSHYQSLWCELAKQDLRMAGDAEAQIAAAAVGVAAAAASVAKAASAAARVASNAALQAKLMADEAFIKTEERDASQRSTVQIVESASTRSSYILVVAEKEAKGKIQADSAAAKQAENLRYILEAAELAAKAVSQAGKVVAMGERLPLKEILSAGPEGYWKLPEASSELVTKSADENEEQVNIGSADHGRILAEDISNYLFGNNTTNDKDPSGDKSHEVSDVVQSNSGLSVLGSSSGTISLGTDNGSNIKEGSAVEVFKDGEALKPAWFSASVLSLNDGKAHVQYTSLLSKEGSDHLKEWVGLEGEGEKAPRIRAFLPMTASHSQGTRKRRRSALGNHVWMVGDMVDVRIQDSWYEGIVTDKNENDEATLTVHFPARGETSAVSTQQVRFSRMWTDGNWVQWSRLSVHDSSIESDMPLEKRARLKSPLGKPNSQESNLQALSASDMNFNVGKSSKAEKKPNPRRPWKTGVSGVPKPGIKRKFVEVSKQFPASQNAENNESKDQVKLAKCSRGGKNLPKADTKEKQPLKVTSLKPHYSSSRTLPKRDNLVSSASSELDVEKSAVHEEDTPKLNHGSSGTNEATKRPQGKSSTRVDEENAYDDSSQVEHEPRRSNRRIQPTHKLLEGLQSSLIIPKMTSVSNDKGQGQKSALSRGK